MPSSPVRSPPSSPLSPRSPLSPAHRRAGQNNGVLPGFRAPPREKRPIAQMTVRELQDLQNLNNKLLSNPGASTSSYAQRIYIEQAAIEERLVELQGVESINTGLKRTHIRGENDMSIDGPSEPISSRTIEAKRKALSRYRASEGPSNIGTMSMQEAMDLERQAFLRDQERRQQLEEKQRRRAQQMQNTLTAKEREARILAFMNYKPSDSDLEDDDEDEDDDDPATWFEDDQDDGRKGQDIVDPDEEDYSHIIRVDENHHHYNTFYEPRDND
ncbi:hypothetical protein HGRIS_009723 [Hohenbuehelia grisea]|uniref:Uncharacterized protein n=1 Tax=Hohenbuehelia grisea TaxID=104357 RepID=A0ABR3J2C2_9AGAR